MSGRDGPALRVWLACDWFVKYTTGLAKGLSEEGCEVVLLTRAHDYEFGGQDGEMASFVAAALEGRAKHLQLGGRVRDPAAGGEVLRLRRAARHWQPDLVHVQDSLANDLRLAVVSGLRPGRYAVTVHDPVPHPGDAVSTRRARLVRRTLRRKAGLLFVHSDALAEELRAGGDVQAPVVVVPHGVDSPRAAPFPPNPSLLFFGRMSHYKGLDTLLDAMPAVWDRHPDITLVVAGEGEVPPHQVLLDPRVELRLEHVPDPELPGLFAAASCVVLPYRQASQSGVGSLAKQHGRPVIATRVGGLPELVGDDEGVLVDPEDPAALAVAIADVVGNPGRAAEMGSKAASSSVGAGWRSVAERTVDAYRRYLLPATP